MKNSTHRTLIHTDDIMQKGYEYVLVAPEGADFDPIFTPDLTPKEMLALGVFGGHYFEGQQGELPPDWFFGARMSETHDPMINYFQIDASQSREEWQKKGWIHPDDPRGWFQWYCRYYTGRRIPEEDARQIKRWKNITRHIAQIKKYCAPGDLACRRRQRQAVLHWAYDSRKI